MGVIKNGLFYPSAGECSVIRTCAKKSARKAGVRIEPGSRVNLEDGRDGMNIALITEDQDWNNTDLCQMENWYDFRYRGVPVAENGAVIVDFYVFSLGENGELETNVTAYFIDAILDRVDATGDPGMWPPVRFALSSSPNP